MLRFVIIVISVLMVGTLCMVFGSWRLIHNYLEERKQRQLTILEDYNKRLRTVVERLLARADEIDQEQKYLPVPVSADSSRQLAHACSELVILGDSLKVIDTCLESRDVHRLKANLLRCCRVAVRIARELEAIKP